LKFSRENNNTSVSESVDEYINVVVVVAKLIKKVSGEMRAVPQT
jgi:hypothetical protein